MWVGIDIGNTIISVGLFQKKRLIKKANFHTDRKNLPRIINLCQKNGFKEAFISSVVPSISKDIIPLLKDEISFHFLKPSDYPYSVKVKSPGKVGMDRLLNSLAAFTLYGGPAIVIDSGTALTLDYISKNGSYLGGIILPGLEMSRDALNEKTGLLPRVKISPPQKIVGKDTVSAIQSGLFFGFGTMLEGLIQKIKRGRKLVVLGTGGRIEDLDPFIPSLKIIDLDLTLKGIALLRKLKVKNSKFKVKNSKFKIAEGKD